MEPRTLLGDRGRDESYHLVAKGIASIVFKLAGIPVLLTISLKGREGVSGDLFRQLLDRVEPLVKGAAAARKANLASLEAAIPALVA
jgi:site-specific recombinase